VCDNGATVTRTIFIHHKWNKRQEKKWLPWLEKKLRAAGHAVEIRELPGDFSFSKTFSEAVLEEHGIHHVHVARVPIGCLTLLRYIEYISHKQSDTTMFIAQGAGNDAFFTYSSQTSYSRLLPQHVSIAVHTMDNQTDSSIVNVISTIKPDILVVSMPHDLMVADVSLHKLGGSFHKQ
jgi:hypothetical protein